MVFVTTPRWGYRICSHQLRFRDPTGDTGAAASTGRAIGLAFEGTSTLMMLGTQAKERATGEAATLTDNAASQARSNRHAALRAILNPQTRS